MLIVSVIIASACRQIPKQFQYQLEILLMLDFSLNLCTIIKEFPIAFVLKKYVYLKAPWNLLAEQKNNPNNVG